MLSCVPTACLSTSSVRGSRYSPRQNRKDRSGSRLGSASVVSRVMAVNSSHIKGRGSGQTASVHPFSRALTKYLQSHAPLERCDCSNSIDYSPQVRTSSSDSVLQIIKNVTIKDVIYWVSESWDNVTQECLVKSWKKLWPSLADFSKVEQGEANKSEVLPLIKCIPGCEDAIEHTVTEWLSCDTEANQLYTDEDIISLVQNKPRDDSDLEETNEPENVLVSHSEAANAVETALRYIEQSENATSTDIMFMRRWRNIASTSRITSLRQTNLTNFFTPKDR
ncbi:hypothetical protein AVEN_191638-1 [Araneus ventricosus]|uniref:DDE-1 domain-containing protein n=1 Tax=Araneus ventricosus TaxID=182803 RepID=A0A4Y2MDF2_ARAVE|nr:hypothetical protein AVEN_191638-1 [Araneus ventricosus]